MKHRVFCAVCVLLPLYHLLVVNRGRFFSINEIPYSYYAVDYSLGFCSRMLPGAVYRLLVGVYSKAAVEIYLTAVYAVFFVMLALLTERFVLAFPAHKKECLVLALLFCTGPFTFAMFIRDFGMLDFYWVFFFFAALLCLPNRYLRFLVPVAAALTVMTNYGGLVSYVAPLLLIVLFFAVKEEGKRERAAYLAVFGLTLAVGVGFAVYFVLNDTSNLVYSQADFDRIVEGERHANAFYYNTAMYRDYDVAKYPFFRDAASIPAPDPQSTGLKAAVEGMVYQIRLMAALRGSNGVLLINALSLVASLFFFLLLFKYLKQADRPLKKAVAACMIVLPVVSEAIEILFSNDIGRWAGHSFITLLVFVFYVLHYDWKDGMRTVEKAFSKTGYWLIFAALFFYSCLSVNAYVMLIGT